MYVGIPNPNIIMPLEKMTIEVRDKKLIPKRFQVLYNPASYVQQRSVNYRETDGMAYNSPMAQFIHGGLEVLQFQLFFDSMTAGAEVGGSIVDRALFTANSILPSKTKFIDVRKYTSEIYNLMIIDDDLHHPPEVYLEWSSLQFEGYLVSCSQNFIKFSESGTPVRAWVQCTFIESVAPLKSNLKNPLNSPDTTRFRTVCQGDSLWAMAAKEYGQPEQWRAIASANGLVNPRLLRSGQRLSLPALIK